MIGRIWRKWGLVILILLYISIIIGLLIYFKRDKLQQSSTTTANRTKAKVIKVIDGDTIKIENGLRIRYLGIDTPQIATKSGLIDECFSREALNKNKEFVEGKTIELEKDLSEMDRYGRLLRYVYIPSASSGQDIFINDYLLRQGYASLFIKSPDVKYQNQFEQAEKEAKNNNRGLWQKCGF